MKRTIILTLVIILSLVGVAAYALPQLSSGVALASTQPQNQSVTSNSLAPNNVGAADLEAAFQNIYAQVNPSVVAIDVVGQLSGGNQTIPGLPGNHPAIPPQGQEALGSGFIWDTQGYIVTNNHVIDGASNISVTLYDGTIVPAKLIGRDPDSDLAVIQVTLPGNQYTPVQVADSKQLKVGQLAIAIGNPYGEQNTMTTGIISALGRSLPAGGSSNQTPMQAPSYTIPDVIQTDAPINPGNSGGVLLNLDGKVVGVTAAIESGSGSSAGIGFAIPSAIVSRVVPELIKNGSYVHPYLGISGGTLTPDVAKAMGIDPTQRGAVVATVTPGGPAGKAGLRGGSQQPSTTGATAPIGADVITAIDKQTIKTFDDIVAYLANSTQVGQTVTLTVLRDGKQQTIQVTLAPRPTSQQ